MSDTINPYAAPHAAVEPSSLFDRDGDTDPAPWATGEVLSQSLELFKQHWAPLLGGLVLGYALVFGVQMVLQVGVGALIGGLAGSVGGDAAGTGLMIVVTAVSAVISMVLQAALACAWARLFLMAARGETPEIAVLFSSFGLFPQMLIAMFIVGFGYVLGMVLLVVPGVIFMLGTLLYTYFIADGERGLESVSKSWEATKGQKGALFVFLLALVGINLLGMLACGLGMLVSMPVSMLALAIVYTRMTGRFAPRG